MSRRDWFATSSCHWCGHMRKRHESTDPLTPNDGSCHGDPGWECDCKSFAVHPLSVEEARARWLGGEGVIKPPIGLGAELFLADPEGTS